MRRRRRERMRERVTVVELRGERLRKKHFIDVLTSQFSASLNYLYRLYPKIRKLNEVEKCDCLEAMREKLKNYSIEVIKQIDSKWVDWKGNSWIRDFILEYIKELEHKEKGELEEIEKMSVFEEN